MPPRHSFWVILIGKTPTSFRAKEREDLVPTLRQLQRTQSDVTLRWFERGKVWESPEAAIGAAKLAATEAREKRSKEWRPGGEHRDPKARFELTRDQKRAKFKRDRPGKDERPDDRPASPFGPRPPRGPRPDRPWSDRSKPASFRQRDRPDHARSDRVRPAGARPDRPWSDRPKFDRPKPGGSPFAKPGPRPPRGQERGDGRDRGERSAERPDRPWRPPGESPFKDRPRSDRRPPSGRPGRPGRPGGGRGGFKPPKRRS